MDNTLAGLEEQIKVTKNELKNVTGTPTEVYARIVGYYRAVRNWNRGKRAEFDDRKLFTPDYSKPLKTFENTKKEEVATTNPNILNFDDELDTIHYEMYTRKTCPNCPAVKAFMSELDYRGIELDVDTKAGLARAASNGVFSSPTVIFYDKDDNETARFHSIEELERVFSNKLTKLAA